MPPVYVSVGSNIDRENNIRSAIVSLQNCFPGLVLSSVYETAAEGFDGDPFYNLVVGFETDQSVGVINHTLRSIENDHGRERPGVKFSSRTLDLDLLLYGDQVFNDKDIPRDEITRYAFVLKPLAEIAPDFPHPQLNKSIGVLWENFVVKRAITDSDIRTVDLSFG